MPKATVKTPGARPGASGRINILLVDDREENLTALAAVLEHPDYDLVRVQSGRAALREILDREFALILLDVQMPVMDGFEVAALIRQRERSRDIPIIFITAISKDEPFVYRGYSAGAVDYIFKPFDPGILRSKVAVFADLHRKTAALLAANQAMQIQALERLELDNLRRYRGLADAIPHMVGKMGPAGELEFFNRFWSDYTGLDARQSAGNGWHAALHAEDMPTVVQRYTDGFDRREAFEIECRIRRADGEYRWFLIRVVPEKSPAGRLLGWLGTGTDIHDRKVSEAAAFEAIRMRDEFLGIASHELKTPLTPLKLQAEGLVRLIRRGETPALAPERFIKALQMMDRQLNRLNKLVDELLDVSRINSGHLLLQPEWMDLGEVVRELVARHEEDAERAGCEVEIDAAGGIEGYWDRLRIEQVFINLFTNAVKYAPGRPIRVRVENVGEQALLTVTDQGGGIALENRERVFGRFERAVSVSNYGGLGLGLYIVRQILESHDGSIELDSDLGRGCEFKVRIPLRPACFAEAMPPAPVGLASGADRPANPAARAEPRA